MKRYLISDHGQYVPGRHPPPPEWQPITVGTLFTQISSGKVGEVPPFRREHDSATSGGWRELCWADGTRSGMIQDLREASAVESSEFKATKARSLLSDGGIRSWCIDSAIVKYNLDAATLYDQKTSEPGSGDGMVAQVLYEWDGRGDFEVDLLLANGWLVEQVPGMYISQASAVESSVFRAAKALDLRRRGHLGWSLDECARLRESADTPEKKADADWRLEQAEMLAGLRSPGASTPEEKASAEAMLASGRTLRPAA